MSEDSPPPSLDELDARLRAAKAKQVERAGKTGQVSRGSGISFAFRIGVDLVAGVVVGAGIGLGLDYWLGTKPWFMILFFFLGAGAGMLNVYRTVMGLGHTIGYKQEDEAGDQTSGNDE